MNIEILKSELIHDEGFRANPYRCTSEKLTTGVGRNYASAAGEMLLSVGAEQVGARASRLARMMRTGVA